MIRLAGEPMAALSTATSITLETAAEDLTRGKGDGLVFHIPLTAANAQLFRDLQKPLRATLSHVMVLTLDDRKLVITDGFVHETPDVATMAGIVNNAIAVAQNSGIQSPRVAVLSAVELVSPQMESAIPAAVMEAMGRRGQFGPDVYVEGPLSMDVALSEQAAAEKKVDTPVAAKADVLVGHTAAIPRGIAVTLKRYADVQTFVSVLTDGKRFYPFLLEDMSESDVTATLAFCGMD